MIDAVLTLILVILVGFIIILPVYVKVYKEQIWEFIAQRLEENEKAEQLRKNMKQRKKGNQGKTKIK